MPAPHEACGVFGIWSPVRAELALLTAAALFALQHRGQESAGIAVNDDGVFTACREPGLVGTAFTPEKLEALGAGNIAVGHVRYSTTGGGDRRNIQPLLIDHCKGTMALAHNGNLTNSLQLRRELEERGSIFHTTSDTEVLAYRIVQERLRTPSIEAAVASSMDRLEGAYSLVISSPAKLIAARDPHGFRPLCMGRCPDGSVVFASETCALDAVGAAFVRDILPGEVVTAGANGITEDRSHCGRVPKTLCAFEYIYFARPDSVLDGSSVHLARRRAGALLAKAHPVRADLVIGVPDSGLDAALGYAQESGIPYGIGFIKNKYIGRTFIAPSQTLRERDVAIKLNPLRSAVAGKRVVLIDDSIVRGTTSRRIVALLREAGAAEIHLRISSPPFVDACYYGTDIDDPGKLIANRHTAEEIAALIGADSLGYLDAGELHLLPERETGLCTACFDGHYPTSVPADGGKSRFERKIHDAEESEREDNT